MKKNLVCMLCMLCLLLALPGGAWALEEVAYLDENGVSRKTDKGVEVTEITGVPSNPTTLSEGWYVVNETVETENQITVSGTVHLILANGASFTTKSYINVATGNSLTIYAQSTDSEKMGALETKNAYSQNSPGIGNYGGSGKITINGGKITARGTHSYNMSTYWSGAGIGSGGKKYGSGYPSETITINGGIVTATSGGECAAGIGSSMNSGGTCDVVINGGTVTANGTDDGPGIGACTANITINGGTVTARGQWKAGIDGVSGTIAINGGMVTSSAYSAGGIGNYGAAVVISGGVVRATSHSKPAISTNAQKNGGIIFEDGVGKVYGTTTLNDSITVAESERLTVQAGTELTISAGVTLTVYGEMYNNGTINEIGDLDCTDAKVHPIKTASCNAEDSILLVDCYCGGQTCTLSDDSFVYDGKTKALSVVVKPENESLHFDSSITYDKTPKNAGDYTATLTIAGQSISKKFTIARANPTYTVPTGLTAVWGTTLNTVSLPSGFSWMDKTLDVAKGGNVGEYKHSVKYTPKDTTNYNTISDIEVTVNVVKADSVMTTLPMVKENLVYNGSDQELVTAGKATGGKVVYKLGEDGVWSTSIPTASQAGSYVVYFKVQGDTNHNDTDEQVWVVGISARSIEDATVTLESETMVYTGQERRPAVTGVTVDGLTLTDSDYTVIGYSDNTNVTTQASVTLEGKGNFDGRVTKTFAIVKANSALTVKTYLGYDQEADEFTFGDAIRVTVQAQSTGIAASTFARRAARAVDGDNTMTLYYGDVQLTEPASDIGNGFFEATYVTTDCKVPVGSHTLTAKFSGSGNLAGSECPVTVTIQPRVLEPVWAFPSEDSRYYSAGDNTMTFSQMGFNNKMSGCEDVYIAQDTVGTLASDAPGEYETAAFENVQLEGEHAAFYVLPDSFTMNTLVTILSWPTVDGVTSGEDTTGGTSGEQSITEGQSAKFSVDVSGEGLTYQWYLVKDGKMTALTDGGVYAGTNTATLNIWGANTGLDGNKYVCVITNPAGEAKATFTLYVAKAPTDLPQTGDSSRLTLWLALLGMAGAGLLALRRKAHQ